MNVEKTSQSHYFYMGFTENVRKCLTGINVCAGLMFLIGEGKNKYFTFTRRATVSNLVWDDDMEAGAGKIFKGDLTGDGRGCNRRCKRRYGR